MCITICVIAPFFYTTPVLAAEDTDPLIIKELTQFFDYFFVAICTPSFSSLLDHLLQLDEGILSQQNDYGKTLLHMGIMSHCQLLWQGLLRNSILINISDNQGQTPLHIASYIGYKLAVEQLLSNGADATQPDEMGRVPIHWAIANNHPNTIRTLLDGTNTSDQLYKKDQNGFNAFEIADYYHRTHISSLMDQLAVIPAKAGI